MSTEEPQPPAPSDDLSPAEMIFLRTIGLPTPEPAEPGRSAPSTSREEAMRLLDGYRASEWLESTRVEFDADVPEVIASPASLLRTRIGPYRVRRILGRNGSTAVYKAWQSEPIPRWVALKVLLDAEEGGETLVRFRREQAVLARLDHPSIARLLDAGGHGDAAWFAMEFVDGDWITRWCREHRLARRDRVRLLRDAARAVEHAHSKGVIHRDLKPSNILAYRPRGGADDEPPRIMIIDFGIARGTQGRLQRLAAITAGAPLLGTLASMAPEQLTRGRAAGDVRADLFALGSILHELAVDRPIRDSGERSLPELVREIVEREPASLRSVDPTVDRDLEAIAGKALRLDPSERYQTAAALADDLDRWLAGDVVAARRATWRDRAWRWLRRHQRASATALAAALLLTAMTTIGSVVSEAREQDRLRRLQSLEETLAEVDRLREIAGARQSRATLIRTLDEESASLLRRDPEDPRAIGLRAEVLQHRVRDRASELHDSLPRPDVAGITKEMVGLRRRAIAVGDSSPEALERLSIAIVHDGEAQRPDLEAVRERFLQALAIDESLHAANPSVRRFHDNLVWSHHRLGSLARAQRRSLEAEARFAAALEVSRSLLAAHPDSPFSSLALGASAGFLGTEIALQGRLEDAEPLLREGVESLEVAVELAPVAPVFLTYRLAVTLDLASLLVLTDRPEEALAVLDRLSNSAEVLLKAEGSTEFLALSTRRDALLRARIAIAGGDAVEASRHLEEFRDEELRDRLDRPEDDGAIASLEVEILLREDRRVEAAARLEHLMRESLRAADEASDPIATGRRLREVLAVAAVLEAAEIPLDQELAAATSTRLAATLDQLAARRDDADHEAADVERDLRLLAVDLARRREDDAAATSHLQRIESLPPPRDLETAVRLGFLRPR